MNNKLRYDITRIAQGNIQEVLNPILDRIEALEEALAAKSAAPEVVQDPDETQLVNTIHESVGSLHELDALKEQTLEGENDYVIRNTEDEECQELTNDTPLDTEPEAPLTEESTSDVEELETVKDQETK